MSRSAQHREVISTRWIAVALVFVAALAGCDQLDGRSHNRVGNRRFRDSRFIDAAAEYEAALKTVKDDRIQYNIGLAYSRIFKPGLHDLVLLAPSGSEVCGLIPGNKPVTRRVCVKNNPEEEDRTYVRCAMGTGDPKDAKKDAKPGDNDGEVCPASATCKELELCAIPNDQLVDLSVEHLANWLESQPSDEEIKERSKEKGEVIAKLEKKIADLDAKIESTVNQETGDVVDKAAHDEAQQDKAAVEEQAKTLREERDEIELKFRIRELITKLYLDSEKFDKAIAYWSDMLKKKPGDLESMGNIAGIYLKSGEWKKSIEWYTKVAETANDEQSKLTAYGFIGNVAWSKLNSKTLGPDEAVQLADLGIGALQKAHDLAPKNVRFLATERSLYGFRSLVHGASWASAIDRASQQDLTDYISVQSGKAKKPPAGGASKDNPKAPAKSGKSG